MSSCLLSVSPLSSSPIKFLPSTSPRSSSSTQIPYTFLKRRGELTSRIWASPNESQGKRRSNDGIKMVDPLEAKRLAAKQLQEIQAKEKLRRQRRIEAINGAWAMIGLTAGLVVEGQTGKSILTQLSGYLNAVFSFFSR